MEKGAFGHRFRSTKLQHTSLELIRVDGGELTIRTPERREGEERRHYYNKPYYIFG
jgi:hypothetical protein